MIDPSLDPDEGPIKIGITGSLSATCRLSGLQVGSPYPLRVLATVAVVRRTHEAYIHHLFAEQKLCGEWFSYSDQLKSFIHSYGSGYLWGRQKDWTVLDQFMRDNPWICGSGDLCLYTGKIPANVKSDFCSADCRKNFDTIQFVNSLPYEESSDLLDRKTLVGENRRAYYNTIWESRKCL